MAGAPAVAPPERLPRVSELGMLSIGLVAAGVIYLAAYLPHRAPLGPALGLLAAAALVFVANAVVLARTPSFSWWRFAQVARWMLLAYLLVSGMIEYAFLYDHTRGVVLAVMSILLVLFTLNVPLIAAFTVARYEPADG
jgi:hypothetical protein